MINLFYEIEENAKNGNKLEGQLLNNIKKIIIKAVVSYEHFREIKDFKKSDDLRKLIRTFNIKIHNQKDGITYYSSIEKIWQALIRVVNIPWEQLEVMGERIK